jgi:hypothetical protein
MPTTGRSLEEAAKKFTDHLNGVLNTTLTESRLRFTSVRGEPRVSIGLASRAGRLEQARFNSDYGWLALSLFQNCASVINADGVHELRLTEYWYCLSDGEGESFLRWEYRGDYPTREDWPANQGKSEKDWVEPKYYPRHHTQVETTFDRNSRIFDLDRLHIPSGYVPIEDVIRFCIEDLGARFRHRMSDWHAVLENSYLLTREQVRPGRVLN